MTWHDCKPFDPVEWEKNRPKYRPDMTEEEKLAEYNRTMIAPPGCKTFLIRRKGGDTVIVNEYDVAWHLSKGAKLL